MDERKPAPLGAPVPPRLERAQPDQTTSGSQGPPRLERLAPKVAPATAPPVAPGASHGLAAPVVTAAAAVAASLAHAGSMEQESPLHLYYLIAANQAAGQLTLDSSTASYTLIFKKGTIEHVHSSLEDDGLGRFLVQRGAVQPEKMAEAEAARDRFGGDLVSALIGLRLLDPAESFRTLQEHGLGLVTRALLAHQGEYRWDPGVAPPPSSFPLGARWGLLCDAVRRLDGLSLRQRLAPRAHRALQRTGGRVALGDLRLAPQEVKAAGLLETGKSLAEVAAAHPAEADLLHRMALLLSECELLGFGAERPAPQPAAQPVAQPAPSGPTPAPASAQAPASVQAPQTLRSPAAASASPPAPRPASSPVPPHSPSAKPASAPPAAGSLPRPAPPARPPPPAAPPVSGPAATAVPDRAALAATWARFQGKDHFEVLGVQRNATAPQLKIAYFQLAKIYHPDAAPADDPPDAHKLRVDIFSRVSEAWGVVGDDQARIKYLQELASGGAGQVDVMAILKAEQVFHMATILVKTRQYDEARAKLDEAIQLNADEPEFGVWKAWVEFLLAPDKKKAQSAAAAAIEQGLKKNGRCLPGYLFLAQMAKLAGDGALAEKHLRRGLAVDPQNQELARELKYLKK
jgi:hypothetical protein